MPPAKTDRRKFLETMSAAAAGSFAMSMLSPVTGRAGPLIGEKSAGEDYLLDPALIYLNTGTIGPCRRETIEETTGLWKRLESLPLQFYAGKYAPELAEKTRTTAAAFLGCDLDELFITRSTTDGMNAIAQGLRLQPGDRIVTTNQEHEGGLNGWKYLAKHGGLVVDTVNIPFEETDPNDVIESIRAAIRPGTKAISISHVFSSTGLRLPITQISALAKSKNILCLVDGAQAVGAIQVNVKELGCHAYATSGHKWLMGPKGTGLLYIAKEAQDIIRPMQFEDSHNTFNESTGVGNLPGILGLGIAIGRLAATGMDEVEGHNLSLRSRLYKGLENTKDLIVVSAPPGPMATPLLSCRLPDKRDARGFSQLFLEKHKVSFRAVHRQWFNGIRFSTHIFNTEAEVEKAIEMVRKELGS